MLRLYTETWADVHAVVEPNTPTQYTNLNRLYGTATRFGSEAILKEILTTTLFVWYKRSYIFL